MAKSPRKAVPDRNLQILLSASKVFANKGYHEASISDIIDHAGIARGTFYLYFQHKRDVFDQLLIEFLKQLDLLIKPVELHPDAPEPLLQLKDNITNLLNLINHQPEVAKILLHLSTGLDKRSAEATESFYNNILEMIENALKVGIELGIIRKCNSKISAIIILGTVKEVANYLLLTQKNAIPIEEISDEIIQYGMQGILIFK